MNALICGGMGLSEGQMAILNTCAFAPVPIMLYLFNKLKQKKGIRFTYQTCLISFAICIFTFVICNEMIMSKDNKLLKIVMLVKILFHGTFFFLSKFPRIIKHKNNCFQMRLN